MHTHSAGSSTTDSGYNQAVVKRRGDMSDRFTVNLPDAIGDYLQQWAEDEGRKKASLAAFLIELAVRQKYPERFPPCSFSGGKSEQGKRGGE